MTSGTAPQQQDALLELLDDDGTQVPGDALQPWTILVVDDDPEVHESTGIALSGVEILGRPITLLHATDSREASAILAGEPGIAVALIDVVMETEDAGLRLAQQIRTRHNLQDIRIILRTGQPGYAPELDVIRDYDINDYRTKNELTRTRLLTTLTTALRAYEQLDMLNRSRRGLARIIQSSTVNGMRHDPPGLDDDLLLQLDNLLTGECRSLICRHDGDETIVIAGTDSYLSCVGRPLSCLNEPGTQGAITDTFAERGVSIGDKQVSIHLAMPGGDSVIFCEVNRTLTDIDQQLIRIFVANLTMRITNARLFDQLNTLAYHDALTCLLNRQGLLQLFDAQRRAGARPASVILLDIDHFSEINDALGMTFGNDVLCTVATRLQQSLPDDVHIGRFGGDVLALLSPRDAIRIEEVAGLFDEPFEINGYSLGIRVSMGEAHSTADDDGQQIFQKAGMALSVAKRRVRGQHVRFEEKLAEASRERMTLTHALKSAIQDKELELHYQPKIDLKSNRTIGAEALLRWRRRDGQLISPDIFIPLAERSGLIVEFGKWIIRQACEQLADWARQGHGDLHLAINVSAQQILADEVVQPIADAIAATGIEPCRLEVEITESMVIDDFAKVTNCMKQLQAMDICIALDDFGTGFSSLSYLQQLPIDVLKIDRSFVNGIGQPGHSEHIAEMIVALGNMLNLITVVEGIENKEQENTARRWGCPIGQGFLYAPAMPSAAFSDWLDDFANGATPG